MKLVSNVKQASLPVGHSLQRWVARIDSVDIQRLYQHVKVGQIPLRKR